jgi:hypothetical protein
MPSKYVIYDSADSGFLMSASTAPDFAAKHGWTAVGVGSLRQFTDALDGLRSSGVKLDQLRITTHGRSGLIVFGTDPLISANIGPRLAGRGYEDLFAPGANVYLDGCNVAEGRDGTKFLKKLGELFFVKVSGSIQASTSFGFGVPFGLDVVHFWGDTKTLYYSPGPRLLELFEQ